MEDVICVGSWLTGFNWEDILKIVVFLAIFCLSYYVLIKLLNWHELKTIIPEVIHHIMDVEKESRDARNQNGVEITGHDKIELVVKRIEKTDPDIIETAKKSAFRKIGRFVQYVFTNFAEPLILKKYK